MKPEIPQYTIANLCGAIGDVVRTAFIWGQSSVGDGTQEPEIMASAQATKQLLTLCLQREPTDAEMALVIGG